MYNIEDWIVVTKEHSYWAYGTIIPPFNYNVQRDVEYRICTGETVYVNDDKPFTATYGVCYLPKHKTSKISLKPFEECIGLYDWVEISEVAESSYLSSSEVVYIVNELHLEYLQNNCTPILYNGKIVYPEEDKPFKAQHGVPNKVKGYGELVSESYKNNIPKYLSEMPKAFEKLANFAIRRMDWIQNSEKSYYSKEITLEEVIENHTSLLNELEGMARAVNTISKKLTSRIDYLTELTEQH